MFQIGDLVYHATTNPQEKWIQCPDCFGTKTLKVILGDGTEYIIDCVGCSVGYEPPRGVIRSNDYAAQCERGIITGMQINPEKTEYFVGCYIWNALDVFATEEEALIRSRDLMVEDTAQESERLLCKEKPDHSWAWHVYYYRRQIRKAQTDIEDAEMKLGIAKQKAKGKEG